MLEAQGSVLTNKYAEGYPGRRYYGGCEFVDVAETLAIDRAKALFGCAFANVQPHSGAQANQAVFLALLQPGDTILGMTLAAGGHLTHGAAANLSGKWFNAVQYGVRRDDALIDYRSRSSAGALEHKPKLIIAGGSRLSAHHRLRPLPQDRRRGRRVFHGGHGAFRRAGRRRRVSRRRCPHAHVVTTTTHKTLRGPRGGMILTNDADLAKKINSRRLPRPAGRPADACHRRQGRRLRRGAAAGIPQPMPSAVVDNARRWRGA